LGASISTGIAMVRIFLLGVLPDGGATDGPGGLEPCATPGAPGVNDGVEVRSGAYDGVEVRSGAYDAWLAA
jgi:hypothetical protein